MISVCFFSAAGLSKPEISILSDEFLAEVKELLQKLDIFPLPTNGAPPLRMSSEPVWEEFLVRVQWAF